MPLMGVRKRYQGTPRGAALALGVTEAVRSWNAAHGAQEAELSWVLEDNRRTRDMIELLGGRQPGLDFAMAVGAAAEEEFGAPPQREPRPARPHAPSLEELAAHQAMLAQITAPLWLAAG